MSSTPSSSTTSGPTVQNGPIRTPRPISAPRATSALGWIEPVSAIRSSASMASVFIRTRSGNPSINPTFDAVGGRRLGPALPATNSMIVARYFDDRRVTGWNSSKFRAPIHDHRGVGGLRHRGSVNASHGVEFPHIAALALFCDMDAELIARYHGPAELGPLDRHEIDHLAGRLGAEGLDHQHRRRLRHAFDDEHAGHDRMARKVSL